MPTAARRSRPSGWTSTARTSLVNTAKGRVKAKNLAREPRVAMSVADPDNPYRYLGIQGRVVEMTESGRRRAHRQDGEEVSRQGQLSGSHAGRSPHHRQDRSRQSPHERLALQVRGSAALRRSGHSRGRARRGSRRADCRRRGREAAARVEAGDVFVVAQKVVSKAEGAIVRLDEVDAVGRRRRQWAAEHGKDPQGRRGDPARSRGGSSGWSAGS